MSNLDFCKAKFFSTLCTCKGAQVVHNQRGWSAGDLYSLSYRVLFILWSSSQSQDFLLSKKRNWWFYREQGSFFTILQFQLYTQMVQSSYRQVEWSIYCLFIRNLLLLVLMTTFYCICELDEHKQIVEKLNTTDFSW